MNAKVSEIFTSVQGEGKYLGARQVFVRFFECNMHCVWCDTPQAIGDGERHFEEYSLEKLLKRVLELTKDCHSVSLTGGEPLVQKDFLKKFLPQLKKENLTTYLETNGVFPDGLKDVIENVDIVAMDIKLPSSTKCRAYWQEHEEFLKTALPKDVFIKTVVTADTSKEDIVRCAELVANVDRDILFILQPNYFEMKNGATVKCFEFQDYCVQYLRNVRVIPQVHKFMKVR